MLPAVTPGLVRSIRLRDYLIRFALGAAISVGAVVLSQIIGIRFAGGFLAFPAILPASLTLIQEKEGVRKADRDAIGAVLGGVGLAAFAMIGEAGFGTLDPAVVVALALAGWMITCFTLYGLLALLRPEDCDRTRD